MEQKDKIQLISRALIIFGVVLLGMCIPFPIAKYSLTDDFISVKNMIARSSDSFSVVTYFGTILYPYLFAIILIFYIIMELIIDVVFTEKNLIKNPISFRSKKNKNNERDFKNLLFELGIRFAVSVILIIIVLIMTGNLTSELPGWISALIYLTIISVFLFMAIFPYRFYMILFYLFAIYSILWLWLVLGYLLFQDVGIDLKAVIGIILIALSILYFNFFNRRRKKEESNEYKLEHPIYLTASFIVFSIIVGIIVLSHYETQYMEYSGKIEAGTDYKSMEIKYGVYLYVLSGLLIAFGSGLKIFHKNAVNSEDILEENKTASSK